MNLHALCPSKTAAFSSLSFSLARRLRFHAGETTAVCPSLPSCIQRDKGQADIWGRCLVPSFASPDEDSQSRLLGTYTQILHCGLVVSRRLKTAERSRLPIHSPLALLGKPSSFSAPRLWERTKRGWRSCHYHPGTPPGQGGGASLWLPGG